MVELFVASVPLGTSDEELRAVFEPYGTVVETKIKAGYAFVKMESLEQAEAATAATGTVVNGRPIMARVNSAEAKREHANRDVNSIFLGGTMGMTEADVTSMCSPYGEIQRISMKKTFAFVDYTEPSSAAAACALHGTPTEHGTLKVQLNSPENKKRKPDAGPFGMPAKAPRVPSLTVASAYPRPTIATAQHTPPAAAGNVAAGSGVFMAGLPGSITSQQINDIMSPYGRVVSVTVKPKPPGAYAFVDFMESGAGSKAIVLDGSVVFGAPMAVKLNTKMAAAGGRPAIGGGAPNNTPRISTPARGGYSGGGWGAAAGRGGGGGGGGGGAPPAPTPPNVGKGRTTVFVGGVPPGTPEVSLRTWFEPYGGVTSIRMKQSYAFIDFDNLGDAQRACVALNGTDLLSTGKAVGVRINESAEPVNESQQPTLFIGGFPDNYFTNESLRELFAQFGQVTAVDVKTTFAFLDFSNMWEATAACSMNRTPVGGKHIAVRLNTIGKGARKTY